MNVISAPLLAPDPSDRPRRRVALLVDGENLPASQADAILAKAEALGDLLIRRVYGKLADVQAKGWSTAPGFRVVPATTTKNSADLLLTIDALELALDGWADCIVIASSDNDYTHVALKLRERGFPVYGLLADGTRCADLRAAYWGVLTLPAHPPAQPLLAMPQPPPIPKVLKPVTSPDPAVAIVARIVEILKGNSNPKGLSIPALNTELRRHEPFKIGDTPEKTWLKFLSARPTKFRLEGVGAAARVRLK